MDVHLQRVEGEATAPATALCCAPAGDLPNQTKPNNGMSLIGICQVLGFGSGAKSSDLSVDPSLVGSEAEIKLKDSCLLFNHIFSSFVPRFFQLQNQLASQPLSSIKQVTK